ncbi:MAG: hypothetical protein ACRD96_00310 [Bryobacteraceae bacterium]
MTKHRLLLTVALTVLAALTASAADFGGKWTAAVPGRDGATMDTTFNFKVDGDKLTGTTSSQRGEAPIQDGKVSGDSISFKQTLEFGGNSIVILYEGKMAGSEIKFSRKREGGDRSAEFTAKRAAS